jgi:hypothetical protein
VLKPRTGEVKDRQIVVYDLEWYPDTYKLRLAGLYDGDRYQAFTSIGELLDAMMVEEYRGAYIYAHAGGLADAQFLLQEIVQSRHEISVDGSFCGSSAVMLRLQDSSKHRWTLVDSLWTLRSPLRRIGLSIGLHKGGDWTCDASSPGTLGEGDDPHVKPIRSCGHIEGHCVYYAPLSILTEYNRRDCEVLWTALSRLQSELQDLGGELGPTAASCALRLFQRQYLKQEIPTSDGINEASRKAYQASRVEKFASYAGDAYGYPGVKFFDINSSFPASMQLPTPGRALGRERRWLEGDDLALVRAKVTVPAGTYVPPLPYRAGDAHVYHPTGTWEGSFFGVDLRALLETGGRIEKVKWTLRFEPRSELRDYVQTIYELRRNETDEFRRDVYKLLMNSLYGKFAQREEKQRLLVRPSKVPPDARRVMPGVYLLDESKHVPHAHVPVSAVITARSRQLLGGLLRTANERGKVWYADTDSIVTNAEMPTSDALGALKEETDKRVKESAVFLRPKLYRVDDKVKAKGFPRLTRRQFDDLEAGREVHYARMIRIRERLGLGALEPGERATQKGLRTTTRPKRRPVEGVDDTEAWDVDELPRSG